MSHKFSHRMRKATADATSTRPTRVKMVTRHTLLRDTESNHR